MWWHMLVISAFWFEQPGQLRNLARLCLKIKKIKIKGTGDVAQYEASWFDPQFQKMGGGGHK